MTEPTCTLSPDCTFPPHEPSAHPCGRRNIPGDPCEYCGKPNGTDGPCWDCWTPVTIADLKAIAADAGLDTVVTPGGATPNG